MKIKIVYFFYWLFFILISKSSSNYIGCFLDPLKLGLKGDWKYFKSLTLNFCETFCSSKKYKFFGTRNK